MSNQSPKTFITWLIIDAIITPDASGELILDLRTDPALSPDIDDATALMSYLRNRHASTRAIEAASSVWQRYVEHQSIVHRRYQF